MKKIFFMPITILVTLILFSLVANAYPTTAGPSNYEGQQIQRVIDYLRSITMNATANNIQFYLDNGKIIIEPLPKADEGEQGENNYKGGPVLIDPSIFNPGIPKDKRKPWDPSKDGDLQFMMLLASILVHEKYHSENHDFVDRGAGNTNHWLGGTNPFEFEGHMVSIGFLDEVIAKLLLKIDDPNISDSEKVKILEKIKVLLQLKIARVDNLDNHSFGPQIYNSTKLDELKKGIDKLIEELQKKTNQNIGSGVLKITHDNIHSEANYKFAAAMRRFDEDAEKNSQDYAIKIFDIVKTIKKLDINNQYIVEVHLDLDIPSDLGSGISIFYIKYGGQKAKLELLTIDDDPALKSDYVLVLSESDLINVYSNVNPVDKLTELFENGKIEVSDNKPIGRQFEDPCGNGDLDRGEACDYGHDCPNNYVCSDTCICIPPGQGKELPPRKPVDESVLVAETGPNTGIFARFFSSLTNFFKQKEVLKQAANKPTEKHFEDPCGNSYLDPGEACDYGFNCPNNYVCSDTCICIPPGQGKELPPKKDTGKDGSAGGQGGESAPAEPEPIGNEPKCPGSFNIELDKKVRGSGLCKNEKGNSFTKHDSQVCSEASNEASKICEEECAVLGCMYSQNVRGLGGRECKNFVSGRIVKRDYHIHYCKATVVCRCYIPKGEEKHLKIPEEEKRFFKNFFNDLKKLFKIESELFKVEQDTAKEPLEDMQEISGPEDTAPQQACSGNNQFEDSNCLNSCDPNQKCESDSQNPGCFRCNPVCANDEYYDDPGCGGLCTEGVNKCVQTSEDPPCYWCKPTCKIGEFYNDPKCGGLCFENQICALTNPEGPCYSCQLKAVAKTIEEKVTFKVTATEATQDYVFITGTVKGASQIKYIKMTDLFKGKTESYPVLFDKDRTKFTFKEKLELGKHFLTIEADLVSGERIRSEPITANVEQEEKCTGNNIYKDSNCLNACLRNQKCTARDYPPGCYGCESVCGAGEYYNDKDCAGQCTVGQTECTASNEKDCYWCQPLSSGYIYFEFKDIDQDYKQVQTLIYGHRMYFIVASDTFDVRKQLPITITMTVSGEEVFKEKIPNEPELHCRDATGCSIAGPLIKSEWQGKPIYLKAYNEYNTILADFKQ